MHIPPGLALSKTFVCRTQDLNPHLLLPKRTVYRQRYRVSIIIITMKNPTYFSCGFAEWQGTQEAALVSEARGNLQGMDKAGWLRTLKANGCWAHLVSMLRFTRYVRISWMFVTGTNKFEITWTTSVTRPPRRKVDLLRSQRNYSGIFPNSGYVSQLKLSSFRFHYQ